MYDIIFQPNKAIKKAKKSKDERKNITALLVIIIATALAMLFFRFQGFLTEGSTEVFILGIVVDVFIGIIFITLLLNIALTTLTNKGGFYEALTSVLFTNLPISLALLITSLLFFLGGIGFVVGTILMITASVLGLVVGVKTAKELFKTDYLTVIIAKGVIYIATISVMYFMAAMLQGVNFF